MYCVHCGNQIHESSKFCRYCGAKTLHPDRTSNNPDNEIVNPEKSKIDLLWQKFVEIYDAEDADRQRYNKLSSPHIWDLLERLSINSFENFIQEFKDELNTQPYSSIEALKSTYIWSVLGGYRLWLASAVLNKSELGSFKSFSLDDFIIAWKNFDFESALKGISDDMSSCMSKYYEFRFSHFIENAPEAKSLSNATIEKLKTSLILETLNGYYAGLIENTFRK